MKVPGLLGATRYETSDERVPKYMTLYDLESPDVPTSPAYRAVADSGEWPHAIRPYTKNRSRVLYKRIYPN